MAQKGAGTDDRHGSATVLTELEIRALLETLSRRAPTGIRNRALILTLWRAGLRLGEALALMPLDYRRTSPPLLVIREGKGGRQRRVGVHLELELALELWLARRGKIELGRGAPIFCTITAADREEREGGAARADRPRTAGPGSMLSQQYVRQMLAARAARAGIEARVHPHAFRATLAVELHRAGRPVAEIRDVLGHANVATTDAYLRRVFPADAIAAVVDR